MALIILAILGVALVVAGLAFIYPPAALIGAGAGCVAAAYLIAEEGR